MRSCFPARFASALVVLALAASCHGGSAPTGPGPETGTGGAGGGVGVGGGGGAGGSWVGSGGATEDATGGAPGGGGASGAGEAGSGGAGTAGAGGSGGAGTAGGGGAMGTGGAANGGGGAGGAPATCPAVACTDGLVCERYGGGLCGDQWWAEWPMPNSQPDVAEGAPNLATYTDNGDGTVTDEVTKLMWQKVPPAMNFAAFNDAKAYCAGLSLAGKDDWRMPSRIELISIVDYSRVNPAIDPVFGPGQPATDFMALFQADGSVWTISFFTGTAAPVGFSNMNMVRCVR